MLDTKSSADIVSPSRVGHSASSDEALLQSFPSFSDPAVAGYDPARAPSMANTNRPFPGLGQ